MEKLIDMLPKAQFEELLRNFAKDPVQKHFPITSLTTMRLINQVGNTKYYQEFGKPHRWIFTYESGRIVGYKRQPCYF